jgi:hypothetical protein
MPPDTVLPGPTCQCPTCLAASLSSLPPAPAADTGPLTRLASLASRGALHRPCPAALPCSMTTAPSVPDGPPSHLLLLPPHGRAHVGPPFFPLCPAPPSRISNATTAAPVPSFLHPSPEPEFLHPPCTHCKLARPLSGTRRCTAPPIGGRHCRHLGLTMSSASLGFSIQIASTPHFPSIYQCSRRQAPPLPTTADPGTSMSCTTSATPPPCRHLGASPPAPPCPVFSPFCT